MYGIIDHILLFVWSSLYIKMYLPATAAAHLTGFVYASARSINVNGGSSHWVTLGFEAVLITRPDLVVHEQQYYYMLVKVSIFSKSSWYYFTSIVIYLYIAFDPDGMKVIKFKKVFWYDINALNIKPLGEMNQAAISGGDHAIHC